MNTRIMKQVVKTTVIKRISKLSAGPGLNYLQEFAIALLKITLSSVLGKKKEKPAINEKEDRHERREDHIGDDVLIRSRQTIPFERTAS